MQPKLKTTKLLPIEHKAMDLAENLGNFFSSEEPHPNDVTDAYMDILAAFKDQFEAGYKRGLKEAGSDLA